ncbi:copper transporter [Thermoanaerobacter mathranii]|uniref:copper transporter n=1 Tax=Thermoanaerobacter mathranii TaxID=583357 RepID=UPI003AB0F6EE
MNINIKYYVLTIASIFVALGIGIFIGFMLDGQKVFSEQQTAIINELEQKFKDLQTENDNLKTTIQELNKRIGYYNQFHQIIFPELIDNKLSGVKVAIIETTNEFIYSGMRNALLKAGATIESITVIKNSFNTGNELEVENLINFLSNKYEVTLDEKHLNEFVASKLANAIVTGQDVDLINYLKANGYIDFTGIAGNTDFVIIAGGSNNEDNNVASIDIPIIKQAKLLNVPIIGVEQSDAKYSYIDAYKKQHISTIDNVEDIIGQTSLIMVMEGKEGNYGVKTSAMSLMPDSFIKSDNSNHTSTANSKK